MINSSSDTSVASYYFDFLKNLDNHIKLDLISQLSQSIKQGKTSVGSLQTLFGAYHSDETADEIIADLKASRSFNRNIEAL